MKNKSKGGMIADILIYSILIIAAITIIFPFYNMLILSFASYTDAARPGFYLVPRSFTLTNYQRIFGDTVIVRAILISFHNVATGTAMAMVMTIFASYVLSKRELPGRRLLFYFVIFTMYFSGGLIPWFMVLRTLGFVNSIWVMTVPSMLSVFNMILMRNYFMSLPESLEESAKLDGAGEFIIMWRIIVPLSAPILATVALFYSVAFWNQWWNAMLFIHDPTLTPLALLLRRLIIENSVDFGDPSGIALLAGGVGQVHNRALEMATVTVATVPILCVYPFLQKYFTSGIMLGAIKA
ncbi:MAG: carbohydrate ABC transporter permease [Defluviitaleaceae bacterium]|nr:carbohydrate ABC transporter permease [Defluviitaleaceae bacterium]